MPKNNLLVYIYLTYIKDFKAGIFHLSENHCIKNKNQNKPKCPPTGDRFTNHPCKVILYNHKNNIRRLKHSLFSTHKKSNRNNTHVFPGTHITPVGWIRVLTLLSRAGALGKPRYPQVSVTSP